MARRRLERSAEPYEDPADRPDLLSTFEHYGAEVNHARVKQLISCIYHDDRTPSLSVDNDSGLYNCKSCGVRGDVYTLIMEREDCDFRGALTIGAALSGAARSPGGGGSAVRDEPDTSRRRVADGSRDRRGDRAYQPSWRRRRGDAGA